MQTFTKTSDENPDIEEEVFIKNIEVIWFEKEQDKLPLPVLTLNKYPKHKEYFRKQIPKYYSTVYFSIHNSIGLIDSYIDVNNNNSGFGGKELSIKVREGTDKESLKEYVLKGPYRPYSFNKGYKILREVLEFNIVECGLISEDIKSRGFIRLSNVQEYLNLPFVEVNDRKGVFTPSLSGDFLLKPDYKSLLEV